MAGRAEGSCRTGVDVDIRAGRAHIGALVKVPNLPVHQRGAAGGIGPARAGACEIQCGEGSVLFDTRLEPHVAGGAISDGEIGLLPAEDHLHRPAGDSCQKGRDDRVLSGLELAAETAAHVMPDDAHLGKRQTLKFRPRSDWTRKPPGSIPRSSGGLRPSWPRSREVPWGCGSRTRSGSLLRARHRPRQTPWQHRRVRRRAVGPTRLPSSWTAAAP